MDCAQSIVGVSPEPSDVFLAYTARQEQLDANFDIIHSRSPRTRGTRIKPSQTKKLEQNRAYSSRGGLPSVAASCGGVPRGAAREELTHALPSLEAARHCLEAYCKDLCAVPAMGGGTRRRDAGAGGERRKRRKFAGAAATGDLRGMRGVLLTCDVHLERRAIREAFTMLEAFVAEDEERAGELAAADGEDKSGEKGGAKSAAESLASELAQLRGECKEVGGAKASRRFAVAQTGCSGQVLIRFSETADDPVLLTTRALTAAAASGNSGAPHIIRLFPVQTICAASSQAITTALAPLLEQLRG